MTASNSDTFASALVRDECLASGMSDTDAPHLPGGRRLLPSARNHSDSATDSGPINSRKIRIVIKSEHAPDHFTTASTKLPSCKTLTQYRVEKDPGQLLVQQHFLDALRFELAQSDPERPISNLLARALVSVVSKPKRGKFAVLLDRLAYFDAGPCLKETPSKCYSLPEGVAHRLAQSFADSIRDNSLPQTIASISAHPRIRHADRLRKRIQDIYEIAKEEEPDQPPPSLASLKSMIGFFADHPELACPQVVLSPEGHLTAQWREGRGKLLSLRFVDDEDVQFVIFAPDPRRRYKTARVSGRASADSVMALAMPYGVLAWAGEKIEDKVDA